jgi:integrase
MPLKLVPPRAGKSPNYRIRGTYYGVPIDCTAGTPDRSKASKALAKLKADIESGAYAPRSGLTFAEAALSYIRSGGEDRFMLMLTDHFGNTPLSEIDQSAIDNAAHELYPDAGPATRNRQVYTPMSAILKHAKVAFAVRRPKGAQGEVRTKWLWPKQAFALLDAAEKVDREFRVLLALLLYTGLRLSEALALETDWLNLPESFAYIPKTKNGDARALYLPPTLIAELANHPRGLERPGETLVRFRKNGHLYKLLAATRKAAEVETDFHTFRHTWATWMRRYGKLDTKGLMGTGAWKDEKSAARYQHVVVTEEMTRADLLPTQKSVKAVDKNKKSSRIK